MSGENLIYRTMNFDKCSVAKKFPTATCSEEFFLGEGFLKLYFGARSELLISQRSFEPSPRYLRAENGEGIRSSNKFIECIDECQTDRQRAGKNSRAHDENTVFESFLHNNYFL